MALYDEEINTITSRMSAIRYAVRGLIEHFSMKNNWQRAHLYRMVEKYWGQKNAVNRERMINRIDRYASKKVDDKNTDFSLADRDKLKDLVCRQHTKLDHWEYHNIVSSVFDEIYSSSYVYSLKRLLNDYNKLEKSLCEYTAKKSRMIASGAKEEERKKIPVKVKKTKKEKPERKLKEISAPEIIFMAFNVKEATVNYLLGEENDIDKKEYEANAGLFKYRRAYKYFIKKYNSESKEYKIWDDHFIVPDNNYKQEFELGNITSAKQIVTIEQMIKVINKEVMKALIYDRKNIVVTNNGAFSYYNRATKYMSQEEIVSLYKSIQYERSRSYIKGPISDDVFQFVFVKILAGRINNKSFDLMSDNEKLKTICERILGEKVLFELPKEEIDVMAQKHPKKKIK